jgi:hypothetical protein
VAKEAEMRKLLSTYGIGFIVVAAWAIAGCASGGGGGTVMSVMSTDAPFLSGVWQGSMAGTTGSSFPATLTVRPDRTYTIQAGAISSQGRAEAVDGHIAFVSTATTGGMQVGERTGTAVLVDNGNEWGLVGQGRSPSGPYNFQFRKPK